MGAIRWISSRGLDSGDNDQAVGVTDGPKIRVFWVGREGRDQY